MRFCHVSPADQPTEGLHECQCKGRGGKRYEFGKRGWQWLKLSLKNGETVLKVWGVESHSIYLILVEISRLVLQLTLYGQRGYKLSSAEQDKKERYWVEAAYVFSTWQGRPRTWLLPLHCVPVSSRSPHPLASPPSSASTAREISEPDFKQIFGRTVFPFFKMFFFFLFSQPKNLLLLLNKPFITYCIDCCSANCSLRIVTF